VPDGRRPGHESVEAGLQDAPPEVEHIIVETIDPNGPFGAKEVGEGPIVCTMQAIANAVANAIGSPVTEMPLAPWRVLRSMKH
jgi:4-hydroxybenzoyl-CoA reductase subunit alpha